MTSFLNSISDFALPFLEAGLYYGSFLLVLAVAAAVLAHFYQWPARQFDFRLMLAANMLAASFTLTFPPSTENVLIVFTASTLASFFITRYLHRFFITSQLYLLAMAILSLFLPVWSLLFFASIPTVSDTTRFLLYFGLAAALLVYPFFMARILPIAVVLGRREYRRPRQPLEPNPNGYRPKVSLHVPCYSEPPEVVIETLNAINRLDYDNYEVIVIDNNTQDPALWKPLEQHCALLGEKFRFFHVSPLAGAKAGAVNFALRHTSPDVEVIGLLDADYITQPDFLSRLVGYFEKPSIGFVQSSHDYHDWEGNLFQRMCYREYMPAVKQIIPALSEWDSGFTIGTMCLVRRKALEDAGGWAEWCLTE
ncbi:MAG: glycosyl transferase family protein, partial [Halothiobacillaceae bacterium]